MQLNLKNTGVIPVEFSFLFPNDLGIEIEEWADPANYTEEQIHYDLIIKNSLMSIYPKGGNLIPNESVTLFFTYKHSTIGFHKIPVLFRLKYGVFPAQKPDKNTNTEPLELELTSSSNDDDLKTVVRGFGSGKEFMINLTGVTITQEKKYVHIHSNEYILRPVNIGFSDVIQVKINVFSN